jgi:sRNA-binding protein
MSMHLEKAWITTTVFNRRSRDREPTRAQLEHEKWLRAQGLHPEQLEKKTKHINKIPSYKIEEAVKLSNKVGNGFRTATVLENLNKETVDVQMQILKKAARVAPAYNKGGYQLITPGEDIKTIGSKSRRG